MEESDTCEWFKLRQNNWTENSQVGATDGAISIIITTENFLKGKETAVRIAMISQQKKNKLKRYKEQKKRRKVEFWG